MTLTVLSLLAGMLAAAGILLAVNAFRRPVPALAAALDRITSIPVDDPVVDEASMAGRLGSSLTRWIRPTPHQRAQLKLRGISPAQWYGQRLMTAVVLAALPLAVNTLLVVLGVQINLTIPAVLTVLLAGVGWMQPALRLRGQSTATNDDTLEAMLVFIDLVVLERLSNASATQALVNAAQVSDAPLFVQIRRALNRAALENNAPWATLTALAEEIQLPALTDVIAIAQLQDEGASLVDAFRARVEELRDAHLLRIKQEAVGVTQRMDIIKAVPTLAVIVVMVAAPLLNMLGL